MNLSFLRIFLICLGLTPVLIAAEGEAWTNRLEITPRAAIASATCAWSGKGLRLQLVHDETIIALKITPGRTEIEKISPPLPTSLTERIATFPGPASTTNLVWVTFKRQPRAWWLYVDECPVLRLPELGTNSVFLRHPLAVLPSSALQDDYLQRIGSFRVEDSFMIPESNKLADTWETLAGDWSLHTVTGTPVGVNAKKQLSRQPTPQRSPNFYSLDGRGAPAIIMTGEPFHDHYGVRVAVQHNGGTNGVLFLVAENNHGYGFTARTDPASERLVLELWRGNTLSPQTRKILGAVQTELLPGQWLLLEVRIFDDRVVCLADNIEVLRLRLALPPAGRYGLLADTLEGTRFDDFSAASHDDYPLDCADDLRMHTLAGNDAFRARTRYLKAGTPTDLPDPCIFETAGANTPHERRFGSSADTPHSLSVVFMPVDKGPYTCGLQAGWRSPAEPGYRFTCRVAAGMRHLVLEQLSPTNTTVLSTFNLPTTSSDRRVRLTLDALRPNELRALVDNRLVLLLRPTTPVAGAGGIYIAGPTTVQHTLPEYTTRMPLFCDRFEKNLQYVNDPFMRHWASPEGQWLPQSDGTALLRGDIFGRVRMRLPVVEPSTLYLALDETGSNAVCRIEIRNGQLAAFMPGDSTQQVWRVPVVDIPEQPMEGQNATRLFTVGLEDHVLWLGDDTRLLAQAHLPQPARGRHVRLNGFDITRLRQTLVRRENVFDTLFNESLYNWTINGGTWEVVNRFQCEPTWSHMNGQNEHSLAALWSRYDFSGDFCVEFYAGMRMGWYERAGDLNLTVMSRCGTTGDGYSVTTTGWDPDNSQLFTRLWRDGQIIAVSTNYLVPRIRAGNLRTAGYEPLLGGGHVRDMHGAWYGMRFRRVGNRLIYLFDNEPVFDWLDPTPLQDGALGVWTYRNSMMVARVRIAAESITPHRFAFRRLDPAAVRQASPAITARAGPRLQAGGWPAEPLISTLWEADDPVSQPLVRISDGPGDRPELRATAQQGGGTFMIRTSLPPVPAEHWLGWRFELARAPATRINFEFTTGKAESTGFEIVQPWSFVLSGSTETRGIRRLAGTATCAPTPPEAKHTVWTPVEVWLPSEVLSSTLAVRVDGFGNLQPSDVQQGLLGNPPGAWFAVRNFRPIHRGKPELAGDGPRNTMDALIAKIADRPNGKLQRLRVPAALDVSQPEIEWAVPPDASFGLEAHLDPCLGDVLRVGSTALWNSPLLPPRQARLNNMPVTFRQEGRDTMVLLPRPLPDTSTATLTVDLADGRTYRQSVNLRTTAGSNMPPVLVSVEMPEGGLTTFEARPPDSALANNRPNASLLYDDPEQGTCLQVQNRGELQRLNLRLLPHFDMIVTPLLQFRYRGDPMARVSLSQDNSNLAFSENIGVPSGLNRSVILDNAWHTWIGVPIQTASEFTVQKGFAFTAGELRIGSRSSRDQTGRYSSLAFDDIACGPAVGPSRPLAFRPNYSDADGVTEVRYALAAGSTPWDERDARAQQEVRWQPAVNLAVTTPDLATLTEGIHHIVLQARDRREAWSPVADIPFMLDRTPPTVTQGVRATSRYNGTCLDVALEGGVALPVLRNLKVACNGMALNLDGDFGQAALTGSGLKLELDWPKLLRRELSTAQDGQIMRLSFDGVVDLAGNMVPRFEAPIRIDFASDRQPPALLPLQACTNILAWQPVCRSATEFFNLLQVNSSTPMSSNGVAFINFQPFTGDSVSALTRTFKEQPWPTEKYPWLAISLKLSGQNGTDPKLALLFKPGSLPNEAKHQKNDHNSYTLNLPATPGANLHVYGQTHWRPNEWQDILIDVRSFLRTETGLAQAPAINSLTLLFPSGGKQNIQLRAAAIMAPWGADDVLKFRAYDLSGLRGLVWQGGGTSTALGVRPSCLKVPADDALWLKVRLADRPGNLTDFLFIPIPPGFINHALPAEVPFND